MPTIGVPGTTLEYTDQGTGQPVVFVHGSLSDLRVWSSQTETFAQSYRAVTYSSRHYFPNEPVPDGADIPHEVLVDDLAALLRKLDLAPAHLVGQSSGAFVALLLARDQPGLVRSLVLVEPPLLPLLGLDVPPRPRQILWLFLRDPGTAIQVAKFGATGLGPAMRAFERGEDEKGLQAFLTTILGPETLSGWSEERVQRARDNVGAFKALLRGGMPAFGQEDARRVRKPSLLITGELSAPVLHRITDRLEESLPDTERSEIRDASHLMFEDRPEAFNDAVLSFLSRHRN